MAKNTQVTVIEPSAQAPSNMLMNGDSFAQLQRVATMFAASQLVPGHLRGKVADCAIAVYLAHRLNEDPLVVMQNIVIISGKAGWLTQYMIARANRSGSFKGRINWRSKGIGDALVVTAYATLADTGEEVSADTSMVMAKAEGWTSNKKYQSMPEHMLKWRSATMLIRLYCPDVMLGMPVIEEIEVPVSRHAAEPPQDQLAEFEGKPALVEHQATPETVSPETGEVTPTKPDQLAAFEGAV